MTSKQNRGGHPEAQGGVYGGQVELDIGESSLARWHRIQGRLDLGLCVALWVLLFVCAFALGAETGERDGYDRGKEFGDLNGLLKGEIECTKRLIRQMEMRP